MGGALRSVRSVGSSGHVLPMGRASLQRLRVGPSALSHSILSRVADTTRKKYDNVEGEFKANTNTK